MNSRYFNIKYFILLHFLIGAGFLFYIIPVLENIGLQSDSPHYLEIAHNLADSGEFALAGHISAYRPPVYPVFIAVIFRFVSNTYTAVLFAQLLISCLNVFLFYKIAQRYLAERYAELASLIFAVMPSIILYNAMIMSETVFVSILLGTVLIIKRNIRPARCFAAGLLIALLVLTKPYWAIIIVVPLLTIAGRRETLQPKLISAALLFAGIFLLTAAWSLRNYSQLGTYQLTTSSGVNFWIGNNEHASGGYLYEHHPDNQLSGISDELARNESGWRLGVEYLLSNPERLPVLAVKKLKRTFNLLYDQLGYFYKRERYLFPIQSVSYIPKLPALIVFAPYMFFFLLGSYGFFEYRKKFKNFAFLFVALLAVMLVFFGDGRFMYPLFPFMIISAVYLFEIRHKPDLSVKNLIPLLVVVMIVSAWSHDIIKAIIFY